MKDIIDLLQGLQKTSAPLIFVLLGALFVLLALVNRIGDFVDLPKSREKLAAIVGGMFLVIGIGLFLVPPSPSNSLPVPDERSEKTGEPPPVDSPCENKNSVMIISIPGRDYEPATRIKEKLSERGCKVEGPYPKSEKANIPRNSEIRYFHKNDSADAKRIADYIKTELKITLIPEYSEVSGEAVGNMEIWLKKLD